MQAAIGSGQAAKSPLAPWPYFGGKSRVASAIWDRFGDIGLYVEPFCGSGAVLLSRPDPKGLEVVGDASGFIVNTFRAIRSQPDAILDHFATPMNDFDSVARGRWLCEEWAVESAERLRADAHYCDAKAAAWWIYVVCSSIDLGRTGTVNYDWCSDTVKAGSPGRKSGGLCLYGRQGLLAHWNRGTAALHLQALAARLQHVHIYCGDWLKTVRPRKFGGYKVGLMLDPPYALEQRCSTIYAQEWTQVMRSQIIDLCLEYGDRPNVRIALCGLEGEYDLPGWDVVQWTGSNGRRSINADERRALERIWFSPHCTPGDSIASD